MPDAPSRTARERPPLRFGVSALPHDLGSCSWWIMSGWGNSSYGYQLPRGYASHTGRYQAGARYDPTDAEKQVEYSYPVLVDSEHLFPSCWPSADLKEALSTDLKISRALGMDIVRIHGVYPKDAEHHDFLAWWLNEAHAHGLRSYVDVMDLNVLPTWVRRFGKRVDYWQSHNEWIVALQPGGGHGNAESLRKRIQAHAQAYQAAKEIQPDARIGVNLWYSGEERNRLAVQQVLDGGGGVDFIGLDGYVGLNKTSGHDIDETIPQFSQLQNDFPNVEVLVSEAGWHLCPRGSGLDHADGDAVWAVINRKMEADYAEFIAKTGVRTFLFFWLDDKLLVNFNCHHFFVATNRELMPMGAAARRMARRFLSKEHPFQKVDIAIAEVEAAEPTVTLRALIANRWDGPLAGQARWELPAGLAVTGGEPTTAVSLKEGGKQNIAVTVAVAESFRVGVKHVFLRLDLSDQPAQAPVLGWGIVRRTSSHVEFSPKASRQTSARYAIRYDSLERLERFRFLGEDGRAPLIAYGKDLSRGGRQMDCAAALYLWQTLPWAIGRLPMLEVDAKVTPSLTDGRPLILIGRNELVYRMHAEGKVHLPVRMPGEGLITVLSGANAGQDVLCIDSESDYGLLWATHDMISRFWRRLDLPNHMRTED